MAIYRLPGEQIPTAMYGNFIEIECEAGMPDRQGFWMRSFHEKAGLFTIDCIETRMGWSQCKGVFESFVSEIPLPTLEGKTVAYEAFAAEITAIRDSISQGIFEKAVAARKSFEAKDLDIEDVWSGFEQLHIAYPESMVFLVYDFQSGYWLGASPEELLSVRGEEASIMSLAGTHTQTQENTWTEKERLEQSVTSNHVQEVLSQLKFSKIKETPIHELAMGNITHLLSHWKFKMEEGRLGELLNSLHPTPAVCGYPKHAAWDWLARNENVDRALYTGYIGIVAHEMAHFFVVLRCCSVGNNGYEYFAGCGINAASDIDTEFQETEAKMDIIRYFL